MKKQIQVISSILIISFLYQSFLYSFSFLSPVSIKNTDIINDIAATLADPVVPSANDTVFGVLISASNGIHPAHESMSFIRVIGTTRGYYFTNAASKLPDGSLIARHVIGDASTEDHQSNIVRLIPDMSDASGLTYRLGETILKNAEDPRIIFFKDGRIGMTFVIPRLVNDDLIYYGNFFGKFSELFDENGKPIDISGVSWNGYFVYINEQGQTVDKDGTIVDFKDNEVDNEGNPIDEKGMNDNNRFRLGRLGIKSKNNFIVETDDGRYALIDRTNQDHPSSIQVYFFDSLQELLKPPVGYWDRPENTVENVTILGLNNREPEEKWTVIGFNTLVKIRIPEKIVQKYKIKYKNAFLAFIHRAKIVSDEKIYRVEYVLLDTKTLHSLGKPVVLYDPRDFKFEKMGGRVPGVIYPDSAEITKNGNDIEVVTIISGVNDTFLMQSEEYLDELLERFFDNQPKQEVNTEEGVPVRASVATIGTAEACLADSN